MNMKTTLSAVTLAAMVAASFSTIAHAEGNKRGDNGSGPMFVFEEMDMNSDGKVTKDEVTAFQAAKLAAMDTDKDGNLSEAELIAAQAQRQADRESKMAKRMIEKRDANKDGVLSLDEMAPKGDRADKMFDRADTDGDGAISKAEADAMKTKMEKRAEDRGDRDGEGKGEGKHKPKHKHDDCDNG